MQPFTLTAQPPQTITQQELSDLLDQKALLFVKHHQRNGQPFHPFHELHDYNAFALLAATTQHDNTIAGYLLPEPTTITLEDGKLLRSYTINEPYDDFRFLPQTMDGLGYDELLIQGGILRYGLLKEQRPRFLGQASVYYQTIPSIITPVTLSKPS
ncbi:hypothetical protein GF367_01610 [Candidatus Woesearchaeota archaeon]|nr:hypothetical protein [Candidatus Woesearchaeota archaeon]